MYEGAGEDFPVGSEPEPETDEGCGEFKQKKGVSGSLGGTPEGPYGATIEAEGRARNVVHHALWRTGGLTQPRGRGLGV